MTMLDMSLTKLPHGTIMRHDTPWTAIGMSRASWYRHGKPTLKPPKSETRAEMARRINVSLRTLYRAVKADRDEKTARLTQYRDAWLRKTLKKHPTKSDQQIADLWKAHVDRVSVAKITAGRKVR